MVTIRLNAELVGRGLVDVRLGAAEWDRLARNAFPHGHGRVSFQCVYRLARQSSCPSADLSASPDLATG